MAALTALVLVFLVGGTDSSPARHGGPHKCLPPGAETVLGNKQGRIYEHGRGLYRDKRKLWACLFAAGTTYPLTPDAWFPVPAIDWAGPMVAYVRTDIELADTAILVQDLRRPPGQTYLRGDTLSNEEAKVGSVRINDAGGVAWIECPPRGRYSEPETFDKPIHGWGDPRPNCTRPGRSINRVFKDDSTNELGPVRLLDRGRGIDPRSLRLRGSTLTWRKGGKRRTGTLD